MMPIAAERRAESRAIPAVIQEGTFATSVEPATAARGPSGDAEPVDKPSHPLAFGSLVVGFVLGIVPMTSKRHVDLGP
jgi:hypothetical protein